MRATGLSPHAVQRINDAKDRLAKTKRRRLPWKKPGLSRVQKVIAFLEYLKITKGPLAGKKMKLLDAQREFIEAVYGREREDGLRQVRLALMSLPKGNGKTGLLAGLALCHLLGPESEARGEIYSAAIDRQQAAILYQEMVAIILAEDEFSYRCNIGEHTKKITVLHGDGAGSWYEALSAEHGRSHGLAPSLFVYDELAQAARRPH